MRISPKLKEVIIGPRAWDRTKLWTEPVQLPPWPWRFPKGDTWMQKRLKELRKEQDDDQG